MSKKPFMTEEFEGVTRFRFVGVDPGLVDTGVVAIHIDTLARVFAPVATLAKGLDTEELARAIGRTRSPGYTYSHFTFIEKYRQRSHFNTDNRMLEGVREFSKVVDNPVVLDNTGVKKIVLPNMMKTLGLWQFSTSTHHQDLRSAAAIALLGMIKNGRLNALLYDILDGTYIANRWHIQSTRNV